jgi:hypothetical protein
VGPGEQQVVLTLPAGTRFGGAARSAVGALARRGGLGALQWARLEAAVDRTLHLMRRQPGDRVRLTFGGDHGRALSVHAELTTERGRPLSAGSATPAEVARFRAELTALVDGPEVDPEGTWARFRAPGN